MAHRFRQFWRTLGSGTRLLLVVWVLGSLAAFLGSSTQTLDLISAFRLEGSWPGRSEVWRLLSYSLITNDPMTLVFGGFLLGWLGTAVEREWTRGWFITFYLISATVAGIAVVVFASEAGHGLLTNVGALIGVVVAWHAQNRHRRFQLFGGPDVSAATAAGLTALGLILPIALSAGVSLGLALSMGGLGGWLAMRGRAAMTSRRMSREASRPRMRRIEL